MTIDPSINGPAHIGAIGGIGGGSSGPDLAADIRSLGLDIVGQVAGSFGLAPGSAPGQGDIYGLGGLADRIGAQFGGSNAADIGALTRELEEFASAIASDMAAYADGRTLDHLDGAVAASPLSTATDIGGVIDALAQARTHFDTARS